MIAVHQVGSDGAHVGLVFSDDVLGHGAERADELDWSGWAEAIGGRARQIREGKDPAFEKSRSLFKALPFFLLRPLLRTVAQTGVREAFTAAALLVVVATARIASQLPGSPCRPHRPYNCRSTRPASCPTSRRRWRNTTRPGARYRRTKSSALP